MNDQVQEFYEDERSWLQKNSERYLEAIEDVKDSVPRTFLRMARTLHAVVADDPAEKSVWAVAQCRVFMEDVYEKTTFITEYERRRSRLVEWDQKSAAEEE